MRYGDFGADTTIADARKSSIQWARDLLALPAESWVILDTETTGLSGSDQVCQIGVIDGSGKVLLDNQLICPTCVMDFDAEMVHGLNMERLKDAPTFGEMYQKLAEIVAGRTIVIYNADFDTRIINQSMNAHSGTNFFGQYSSDIHCAMKRYAAYVGEWSNYHGNFRFQRLPDGTHDALGDCRATLNLIKRMAESE